MKTPLLGSMKQQATLSGTQLRQFFLMVFLNSQPSLWSMHSRTNSGKSEARELRSARAGRKSASALAMAGVLRSRPSAFHGDSVVLNRNRRGGDFETGTPYLARNNGWRLGLMRTKTLERQIKEQLGAIRNIHLRAAKARQKRFAGDLEAGVAQFLLAVNLRLKHARAMGSRDHTDELIDDLLRSIGASIRSLRHVTRQLNPDFLQRLPLHEAIRQDCQQLHDRAGISTRVIVDEAACDLDECVKEQCFLGVRLAVENAVQHAKASRIDVIIQHQPAGLLRITIIDDGMGFDVEAAEYQGAGTGLAMIREYAESLYGYARIDSSVGKGTSVSLVVPQFSSQRETHQSVKRI